MVVEYMWVFDVPANIEHSWKVKKMEHPSDVFYHGLCGSLDEALDLNVQQFAFEKNLWPEEEKTKATFTSGWKEAIALRDEYGEEIRELENTLMKLWLQRGGQAQSIAEAYFSGDYTTLAI
jgi:hypothetical protein